MLIIINRIFKSIRRQENTHMIILASQLIAKQK